MKRIIVLVLLTMGVGVASQAQQQAMFTNYIFNPLPFNPAVTGSSEALDMVLLHRHQWFGLVNGAPLTQNFSIHSPIKIGKENQNAALGGYITHDQIGATRTFSGNFTFSYRLRLNNPRKEKRIIYLNIGLSGGIANWSADFSQLNLDDANDPSFQNFTPTVWMPNFGAGLYLHSKMWYVGLSAPKLWTNNMRERRPGESPQLPLSQEYRHYYLMAGGAIEVNDNLTIRPSFILRNVGLFVERNVQNIVGAPNTFSADLGFIFAKRFWLGASFRSSVEAIIGEGSSYDSVDFWMGFRLKNGLRFGLAYDLPLNDMLGPGIGSYEVMLGYDLYKTKYLRDGGDVINPRYLTF
ncbi:MAG: type IX secretion system membrane protein PorP/SprF [Aureispira sp.]